MWHVRRFFSFCRHRARCGRVSRPYLSSRVPLPNGRVISTGADVLHASLISPIPCRSVLFAYGPTLLLTLVTIGMPYLLVFSTAFEGESLLCEVCDCVDVVRAHVGHLTKSRRETVVLRKTFLYLAFYVLILVRDFLERILMFNI
jgi:hypothetical protein